MADRSIPATFVFVGTYTRSRPPAGGMAGGIAVFRLDLGSGELTLASTVPDAANPSYLALHPSQPWLYAVSEEDEGGVSAFAVDTESGALTPLNQHPSHGSAPAHISVDRSGRWVLTANYTTGGIAVLPIQDDGSLAPAVTTVQHQGRSVNPRRQEGPHAHYITTDQDNRFVLVADLGLDAVMIYRFDPERGTLTPNDPPSAALDPGAGPRHIAFHPSGRFAYVINELDSTLVACEYDAEHGTLRPFQSEPTLPADFAGESTTAAVRMAPSGRFVYGSNRGHDSLAIFAIDPDSGRLTFVDHVSTQGQTPRDFNIDPTGAFLLAANQGSNTIVTFRVDPQSGRLTPTGHVAEVMTPVCVEFGLAG